MKTVVSSLCLSSAVGTTLTYKWSDCSGGRYGVIKNLSPTTIAMGQETTITGTGTSYITVNGGTFNADVTVGPLTLMSCTGPFGPAKTCTLPLGFGSITLDQVPLPVTPGPLSVKLKLDLASNAPAIVAMAKAHVTAITEDKKEALCVDLALERETEPASSAVLGSVVPATAGVSVKIIEWQGCPDCTKYGDNLVRFGLDDGLGSIIDLKLVLKSGFHQGIPHDPNLHSWVACAGSMGPSFGQPDYKWYRVAVCANPGKTVANCAREIGLPSWQYDQINRCMKSARAKELVAAMHKEGDTFKSFPWPVINGNSAAVPEPDENGDSVQPTVELVCKLAREKTSAHMPVACGMPPPPPICHDSSSWCPSSPNWECRWMASSCLKSCGCCGGGNPSSYCPSPSPPGPSPTPPGPSPPGPSPTPPGPSPTPPGPAPCVTCEWNSQCPSGQDCYYSSSSASSGCCSASFSSKNDHGYDELTNQTAVV